MTSTLMRKRKKSVQACVEAWSVNIKKVLIRFLYVALEDPDQRPHDKGEDEDIMSYLNYRKLEEIKKDFNKSESEGLTLKQFVKVMLNHLGAEYSDKSKLVKELIELFKQIDVNNDKTLEWEEFTNHIIELGNNGFFNYVCF